MADKFRVSFAPVKVAAPGTHGHPAKAPHIKKAASADVLDFSLQEGNGDTVTVHGINAAGDILDISGVATIAVTSDNPNVLTVDTPVGMTYGEHAKAANTAKVTVVATWNDNTKGPFSFSYDVICTADPNNPVGIIITHGVPTPN